MAALRAALMASRGSAPAGAGAGLDPTAAELDLITDYSSAARCAGLPGSASDEASPCGSFLKHLLGGDDGDGTIGARIIGNIPELEWVTE